MRYHGFVNLTSFECRAACRQSLLLVPFRSASQTTRNSFECRSVMHVRRSHRVIISSSLANGSTFITTTKSRVIPLQTRSQLNPSPSLPTSSPFYCTGGSDVSIRRRTSACVLPLQHVEPFTLASGPRCEVSLAASQPRTLSGNHSSATA